jgi:hypothetical protein
VRLQDFIDAAELHRLERERERRRAAGGEGQERVVVVLKIVALPAGEPQMEGVAMPALVHHVVEQPDRYGDAFDVRGGGEQVEALGQRRRERGLPLGDRTAIHEVERVEQLAVHPAAVQQRDRIRRRDTEVVVAVGVVEQLRDVSFVEPQLLDRREIRVVGERLGQEDAVDAAGRGSGDDVDDELGANHVVAARVRRRDAVAFED